MLTFDISVVMKKESKFMVSINRNFVLLVVTVFNIENYLVLLTIFQHFLTENI